MYISLRITAFVEMRQAIVKFAKEFHKVSVRIILCSLGICKDFLESSAYIKINIWSKSLKINFFQVSPIIITEEEYEVNN